MSDWTKEPWQWSWADWRNEIHGYHAYHAYIAGDRVEEEDGHTYSTAVCRVEGNATSHDVTEANARRIVACVNACVGIPTEELEEGPNLYALRGMVNAGNEVRAQRDELLAVCEALGDDIQRYLERGGTLTETELRHYERLITVVLRCGLAQAPPAEESP